MSRTLTRFVAPVLAAAVLSALGGCATLSDVHAGAVTTRPAAASVNAGDDWAWSVSGDPQVRPIQVFSLGDQTYFEMRAHQLIPAIFVAGKPVPFMLEPPYLIVQGKPANFDLIADGYRAVVVHDGPVAPAPAASAAASGRVRRFNPADPPPPPAQTYPLAKSSAPVVGHPLAKSQALVVTPPPPGGSPGVPSERSRAITRVRAQPAPDTGDRVWLISPSDGTLSKALADWCKSAGATLHWQSAVDLPIRATATYHSKSLFLAMAELLADANGHGYRFFYSVSDQDVVTVISVRQS